LCIYAVKHVLQPKWSGFIKNDRDDVEPGSAFILPGIDVDQKGPAKGLILKL